MLGKQTGAFVTVCAVFVAIGGCIEGSFKVDPDAVVDDPQINRTDWSTYSGLHIYAHEWQGQGPNGGQLYRGYGPVDLGKFENAVLSMCYQEIAEQAGTPYRALDVCHNVNIDLPSGEHTTVEEGCRWALCVEQLSLCAGYKNLEMADAVGPTEFTTRELTLAETPHYDAGRVTFKHETDCRQEVCSMKRKDEGYEVRYKVPPQSPQDRTLLYESAMEFFRAAGLAAGAGITAGCLDSTPAGAGEHAWDPDPPAESGVEVSQRMLALGGFQETVLRFHDALGSLVQNEKEVSAIGGATDTAALQAARWNGEVNSRLSALRRIYGDVNPESAADGVPVVTTPKDDAVEHAIALLRASGLHLAEESTGFELARDALRLVFEERQRLIASSEADAGADAGPHTDGGAGLGITSFDDQDVERYLRDNGLSPVDFVLAAQYLRQEAQVLDRPDLDAEALDGGPPVSFTNAVAPTNPLPALRQRRHSASLDRYADFDQPDPEQATKGAVQAFQYFRDVARIGTNAPISPEDVQLLDRVIRQVDEIAGKTVVVFSIHNCETVAGTRACDVTAGLLNPPFTDEPNLNEFAVLVQSRAGVECLLTGRLGNAPCGPTDPASGVLVRQTSWTTSYPIPGGAADGFEMLAEDVPVGTELFILAGDGRNGPALYGSTVVTEPTVPNDSALRVGPVGGRLEQDVDRIMNVDTRRAADPAYACGALPSNWTPPLENELTEDSDPYENSWRHYLNAAQTLAAETDRLGQEMLDRGLRMDLMAEEAVSRVRDICGDVGPIPDLEHRADSAVEACYASKLTTVSLGGPVCYYSVDGFQCLCGRDDYGGNTICDAPCPMPAGSDIGDAPDPNLACEQAFRKWRPTGAGDRVDPAGATAVAFHYVPDGLDIFSSVTDAPVTGTDCKAVYDFRCVVEAIRNERVGCAQTDFNAIRLRLLLSGIPDDPDRAVDFARRYWQPIARQRWFTLSRLQEIATSFRFTLSQFHNFALLSGSKTLWSTQVATPPGTDGCPRPDFYRYAVRTKPEEMPFSVDPKFCYEVASTDVEEKNWWIDQYGPTGFASQRATKAADVAYAMLAAQLLGAHSSRIRTVHEPTADWRVWSGLAGSYPPPLTSLTALSGQGCLAASCGCVMLSLPSELIDDDLLSALSSAHELAWSDRDSNYWATSTPRDLAFLLASGVGLCHGEEPLAGGDFAYDGRYLDAEVTTVPLAVDAIPAYTEFMADPVPLLVGCPTPDRYCLPITLPLWRGGNNWEPWWMRPQWYYDAGGPEHVGEAEAIGYTFRMLDGLELACYVAEDGVSCDDFDPASLPPVRSLDDLSGVRRHLECVADSIARSARTITLQDVPEELVVAVQRDGLETYFPGVQGRKLEAYLRIEAALAAFRTQADQLSSVIYRAGQRLELYRHERGAAAAEAEIRQLQSMIASLQTAAAAVGGVLGAFGEIFSGLGATVTAPMVLAMEAQIRDLASESYEEGVAAMTVALMMDIAGLLDQLRQVGEGVAQSLRDIQSGLGELRALRSEARLAADRASFELSNSAEVTYRVNEAMRNWLATDRARYRTLLDQTKRMAFIARRAIEFRLGLDMREMHDSMPFVPPPSEWVDQICRMRGIDYDHLSGRDRIRSPGVELDAGAPDTVGTSRWDDWNGRFVGGYVGDYVRMLDLFVESYPVKFPFADGSDTVVLSLKDDLMPGVFGLCDRESYNLLLYTESLDRAAWELSNRCVEVAGEPPVTLCLGDLDASPSDVEPASFPFGRATRLAVPEHWPYPIDDAVPEVGQVVHGLTPGMRYALTWWAADGDGGDEEDGVTYEVSLRCLGEETEEEFGASFSQNPADHFERLGIIFSPPSGCSNVRIVLKPSVEEESDTLVAGSLVVGGWQLEGYGRADVAAGPDVGANVRPYEAVEDSRVLFGAACPDRDGSTLRSRFARRCMCSGEADCSPDALGADPYACAYRADFQISLGGIEDGRALSSAPISPWNFNYRVESVAVNVVGTNVRECDAGSPDSCYGSAYLPYTLVHEGADIPVRNHADQTVSFDMPTARIEHAKALAAEVVLTNPMTGSQSTLMETYTKDEFRGRPLNGNYTLYLWDIPGLNWANVEDVQFVVRYRYWTRMTPSE